MTHAVTAPGFANVPPGLLAAHGMSPAWSEAQCGSDPGVPQRPGCAPANEVSGNGALSPGVRTSQS